MTVKRRPLSADLGLAIDRLRELANASADALIGEGAIHPDAKILEIAADVTQAKRTYD